VTGIVDGHKWLEERMATLRAALASEEDPDRRAAIEVEMAKIEPELRSHRRGRRRWLIFGGRLPG